MIDVTVPLQCLVKDSKLILTEASKVRRPCARAPAGKASGTRDSWPSGMAIP